MNSLKCVAPSEIDDVVETMSNAFQDDPGFSYIFPDPEVRRRRLPDFFKIFVHDDLEVGRIVRSPNCKAVALWRPPGHVGQGMTEFLGDAIPFVRVLTTAVPRALCLSNTIKRRWPSGRFWYLHVLSVHRSEQGKGWGTLLIREGIEVAEAEGASCWLETSNPSNVGFYAKLGFTVECEWDVPWGGPHFWGMRWQASSARPEH